MPTSTVEDYLKSILRLHEQPGQQLTVGFIASELGVTPGTVSSMMRHLSEQGLIRYVPRKSITLLPKGREQALRVVRRHRLIESFLVSIMKLDWAEVHEEAEILEHAVSDRLLKRMDEMLDHPSHDPHGDPIPDDLGNIASHDSQRLADVEAGCYRIVRVGDSDPKFLDWLRDHELLPGCEVEMTGRDPVAGVTEIVAQSNQRTVQLGEGAAAEIFVETVK